MKKVLAFLLILIVFSCKEETDPVFDKPADVRAEEAIAALKAELVRPTNGWRVRYKPESESGAYWVLMDFNENNEVTIKSDLPQNDEEFFEQTITYRIDSSLGLELILESYSFFSFLFEQDQATFLAEYEFKYANKTPQGELVFVSKTDPPPATILLFEEASSNDEVLLGQSISGNLQKFPTSNRIVYANRNVAVYVSIDNLRRTASFNYVALKTNQASGQAVNLTTGFILQGDAIVFDTPLDVTFNGSQVLIESISFTDIGEVPIDICPEPSTAPFYEGFTSSNEPVTLETSLYDNGGAAFKTTADIYAAPVQLIFGEDGFSRYNQILSDVAGAIYFVVYNNYNGLNAMGFLVENPDGTTAIVVREYTATFDGNAMTLEFEGDFNVFGTLHPQTNVANIQTYLDLLTEGGKTYAYRVNQFYFQLYNPCSGWRFFVQIIE